MPAADTPPRLSGAAVSFPRLSGVTPELPLTAYHSMYFVLALASVWPFGHSYPTGSVEPENSITAPIGARGTLETYHAEPVQKAVDLWPGITRRHFVSPVASPLFSVPEAGAIKSAFVP